MGKKKRFEYKKYFLRYTLLFGLTVCLVYCHFFLNGKSFIYDDDGWKQHFKALVYYAKWLRSIVYNLVKNRVFEIPQFSFSIGYGSDILTTLHYYVIGDPLNLFSVFVPTQHMAFFYSALIIVRLYFAGLSFSCFCFYKKLENEKGVLAGAISYAFCGFALYAAVKHPYFVNPMIYFPLLLLGVEKILNEKKPWLFMSTVCISAMSNFYFFYMLVLLTVLYVFGRAVSVYGKKQIRNAVIAIMWIAGYSIIGVMMSAVMLFPILLVFADNPRSLNSVEYALTYTSKYYEQFLTGFITCQTPGAWNFMGYTIAVLLAVIALFLNKKKHIFQKYAFLVLTIFLLLPTAGYIFNGFAYVSNRWVWGYSMLVAYILASMWDKIFDLNNKQKICMILISICYAAYCMKMNQTYQAEGLETICLIGLLLLTIIVISNAVKKKWYRSFLEYGMLCLIVINIAGIAYYEYSPEVSDYLDIFLNMEGVYDELLANDARAVTAVEDTGEFCRYTSDIYNTTNSNSTLISGLSSVQFYWSLANPDIATYMQDMCMLDNSSYNYKKLDNRTSLNTLAGVKYYVTASGESSSANVVPYGYEVQDITDHVKEIYSVYQNQYALPLGYTYTSSISTDEYAQLNAIEKQEALLQGILLEEVPENYTETDLEFGDVEKDYEVVCNSDQVSKQGNSFVVTQKDASITLEFDGIANSETYLLLENLHYKGFSMKRLYSDDKEVDPYDLYTEEKWNELSEAKRNKINENDKKWRQSTEINIGISSENTEGQMNIKNLTYRTSYNVRYEGRHDFAVNMCYDEYAKTAITITFPKIGIYSFDDLKVICQPMDKYSEQVEALREDTLKNVDLHNDNIAYATNKVTGTIQLDESKILCLTIPYSKGWKAYVDGKEQEILQANTMFMALLLDEGEHEICLTYRTPGLMAGIYISCLGFLCFAGTFVIRLKKKKYRNNRRKEEKCFQLYYRHIMKKK